MRRRRVVSSGRSSRRAAAFWPSARPNTHCRASSASGSVSVRSKAAWKRSMRAPGGSRSFSFGESSQESQRIGAPAQSGKRARMKSRALATEAFSRSGDRSASEGMCRSIAGAPSFAWPSSYSSSPSRNSFASRWRVVQPPRSKP